MLYSGIPSAQIDDPVSPFAGIPAAQKRPVFAVSE